MTLGAHPLARVGLESVAYLKEFVMEMLYRSFRIIVVV